jgi:hypothetical protein
MRVLRASLWLVLIGSVAVLTATARSLGPLQAKGPRPTIRDSANIRIVEYASLYGAPLAFRIAARPYLHLGGLTDRADSELDSRHPWLGAVELRNGTIVVNESTRLKFFSRAGDFLRTAGRKGSGPAEFTQTREICILRGDTLLVIDYSDGRLSLWDDQGRHLRTLMRPGFIPLNACSADGTVIIRDPSLVSSVDRSGNPLYEYLHVSLDGRIVHRLGALPAEMYVGPIVRDPVILPYGHELYVADARTFELRVHRLGGRLTRIVRISEPAPAISEGDWRSLVDGMIPVGLEGAPRDSLRSRLLGIRAPTAFPAFRRVQLDPAHRIWVQDYKRPTRWTVFDSAGTLRGQVELASLGLIGPELVRASADHIVVRSRDTDGAVHLGWYSISDR